MKTVRETLDGLIGELADIAREYNRDADWGPSLRRALAAQTLIVQLDAFKGAIASNGDEAILDEPWADLCGIKAPPPSEGTDR